MALRRTLMTPLLAAALSAFTASCASAQGMTGNDTGGIIPWSGQSAPVAREIANVHCERYGRYAVITSVHSWPGGYIGFACRVPDRWGPMPR